MKRKGCVKVNLVGSISENDVLTDRLTSYPVVAVIVDCTAQITGANTQPITPSEYEQFVAAVHDDADRAEQSATDAQGYASDAQGYAQDASDSAQSAHDDKIAIEQAIAEVIQQIEDFEQVQVVVNTLPPSSQATSDFTDGVLTLGIPQGVKGDTGNGIQSITKVSTSGLVDTYRITYTNGQTTTFTVTNGAKGDTGNGIQSIAKTSTVGLVDTYTITYTDGTTTTFTVTNGEKGDKGDTGEVSLSELEDATIVQTLSDTEPYHFRRTNNGQGSGHREYDEIVGASVGWNQLAKKPSEGGTYFFKYSGSISYDGDTIINTSTSANQIDIANESRSLIQFVNGHKYFLGFSAKLSEANSLKVYFKYALKKTIDVPANTWVEYGGVHISATDEKTFIDIVTNSAVSGSGVTLSVKDIVLIDLTLALGSTIADYVYGLEQANAGDGVAWFRKYFPKSYYAYDAGSLQSVNVASHDLTGFNQWDEEWETGLIQSDGSLVVTSGRKTTTFIPVVPNTTYYMSAPTSAYDGRYAFYDANKNCVYANVNGIPSSTKLFTTTADTHYVRITFGSGYGTTYKNDICINLSSDKNGQFEPYEKHTYTLDPSVTLRGKFVLDGDKLKAVGDVWKSDGTITRKYGTRAYQSGDESDATVVTDMTTTVYPLTTPTTESATPYDNPQWCDANGTEEYVSTSIVPIGHNTEYPMTLVDTMPSANGTYEPRVTIANGKRTITWQSV